MTTTSGAPAATLPRWLFFDTAVARVRSLGPSMRRITLTGPRLREFGVAGDDQRVKLVLAPDPTAFAELQAAGAEWYPALCALPAERRPVLRTYTVRAARPELAEVDLDVVLHGADDGHAGHDGVEEQPLRGQDRGRGLGRRHRARHCGLRSTVGRPLPDRG